MHENKLILGDALDTLKELPDNSVDMIFTDPPYNTTDLKLDKTNFSLLPFILEFQRILKPNGWFFTFGTIQMTCNILLQDFFKLKFDYVWQKSSIVPKTADAVRPYYKHEHVFSFIHKECKPSTLFFDSKSLRTEGKAYTDTHKKDVSEFAQSQRTRIVGRTIKNDGYREGTTILEYPNKGRFPKSENTIHPTQKPLALCELICKAYCPKEGIMLDPFMGSGTIPVAANNTDRKYIGVEIVPEYYNIAKDRFASMITSFVEEDSNA